MESQRGSRRERRTVLPTSVKEEERKLGAASTWGKKQLKTLGVDFLKKQPLT
jgi:hypothetical protein